MKDKSLLWWLIGVALIAGLGYLVLRQKPASPNANTNTNEPGVMAEPTFNGEIVIGAILPLTGDAASYGQPTYKAAQLAVDQINKAGGVGGKKLVLAAEDGKCDGKEAATAAQKLIGIKGVQAILGGVCSSETLGMAPIVNEKKVVLISPGSSSPLITTDGGPYVSRLYPSDALAGKAAARYALNEFQAKSAAILSENTDYAKGLSSVFTETLKQFGGVVILHETYNTGVTDFRTQALKIKNAGVDVVYIVPQTDAAGISIMKALRDQGIKTRILTGEVLISPAVVKANAELLEGLIGFEPAFDEQAPAAMAFAAAYKEANQEELSWPFIQSSGYSIVYLLKQLMEEKGMTGEQMKGGLDTLKNWTGGVMSGISLDANGDLMWKTFNVKVGRGGESVAAESVDVE